jgi:hypothetical protein
MLPCLLIALALTVTACDEVNVDFPDGDADADAETDPVEEPVEDVPEEEPEPCEYPSGPYAFTEVGDTVADMRWPSAVARPDDYGRPADLENLYCDADVHSVFIQFVTITCPACPDRMREIALHRDHWVTYGAKWIFVVADAATPAEADAYTDAQGVSFGWSTNDADNSEGAYTIASSTIHGSLVPWTGVIDASDMKISHDEPEGTSLDIAAIAIELAP